MFVPYGLRENETVRSVASKSKGMFILIVAITAFPGFLMGLDAMLFITAAPYIIRNADSTAEFLGMLAAGYSIGIALFSLLGGYLFSRFSAKYTFLLSIGIFSLFTLVSGTTTSETILLFSRLLVGVGIGMFLPTIVAFLGDIFVERRSRSTAVYIGVYSLGLFIAPYIIYAFLPNIHIPFILSMILSLISMILFYLIVPKTYKTIERQPVFKGINQMFNRNTIILSVCMLCYGIAFYGLVGYKSEFLYNLLTDNRSIAIILSVSGISGIVVSYPLGVIGDRFGRRLVVRLVGLAVAVGCVGFFTLGYAPTIIGLSFFSFLTGVGSGYPGFVSTYVHDMVDEHLVGVATGWVYFICNIGGIIGGPLFALFLPLGYIKAGLIAVGFTSIMSFVLTILISSQSGENRTTRACF